MPPKPKITREMVVEAAFEIARESGWENINARTAAKKLDCSTQPVMYHFDTIEELKRAAYEEADKFHTEFLMNFSEAAESVLLEIGLNYIRFAVKEPNLFRFLFQSGFAAGNDLLEMINSGELTPILSAMQKRFDINDMNMEQIKEIFVTLAMFVHGYACIIIGNSLEYDEKLISAQLKRVYKGAVLALRAEADGITPEIS